MSKLSFELEFRSANDLVGRSIPVEVRRPNLTVAARGLSSETIDITPGVYYVSARLPAGQELFDNVEVGEGVHVKAILRPDFEDESPHEWQASQHYYVGQLKGSYDLAQTKSKGPPDRVRARIRNFAGNVFKNAYQNVTSQAWQFDYGDGLAVCTITARDQLQWVQLLQEKRPTLNMALPAFESETCKLAVVRNPDGGFSIDAHLQDATADLLVRYMQKGFQEETSWTGKALDAENLLAGKVQHPIAAAVGAYAILRFGQLEFLHEWTENLRRWFVWLPDGAAIRGEHLARRGRHEEALDAFLELSQRGLPILSDGLSYAVDRLRIYAGLKAAFNDSSKVEKAKALLEKLQPFAASADFREPFTTFTGLEPHQPDSEPLDKHALIDNAFLLADIFGPAHQ